MVETTLNEEGVSLEKKLAEIEKINAETRKLMLEHDWVGAQTTKTYKETRWYELVVLSAAIVALLTAGKFLL